MSEWLVLIYLGIQEWENGICQEFFFFHLAIHSMCFILSEDVMHVGMFGFDFRTTFLPALKFAREQGLHVTLHCGEVYAGI